MSCVSLTLLKVMPRAIHQIQYIQNNSKLCHSLWGDTGKLKQNVPTSGIFRLQMRALPLQEPCRLPGEVFEKFAQNYLVQKTNYQSVLMKKLQISGYRIQILQHFSTLLQEVENLTTYNQGPLNRPLVPTLAQLLIETAPRNTRQKHKMSCKSTES